MKKTIAAAAVLAALALTGCSAGNQSAEPTPSPTAASSASATASASPSASPTKESSPASSETTYPTDADGVTIRPWEELARVGYLENNGANSFKGWGEEYPQRSTISWNAEGAGKLLILVKNGDWTNADMKNYAESVMSKYGCKSGDIDRVKVQTKDGKASASATGC